MYYYVSFTETQEHVLLCPGVDQIFNALSNSRRRLILLSLKEGTVETDADVLTQWENNPEEARISLIHNHLPKLEEAKYIEWDQTSGDLSKGSRFDEIEPLLELVKNHADELPSNWP